MDIADADSNGTPLSLRQRLSEDNRLWLVVMGVIIIFTFWMVMNGKSDDSDDNHKMKALPSCSGSYNDERHQSFTQYFLANKRYSASVLEAGYAGPGNFRIVMSGSASTDDIEYASKMAAKLIEHKVGERAVVNVYLKSEPSGLIHKAARTIWNDKRATYLITFEGENGATY